MDNHKTNTDFEHHPFLEQGKIQGATKVILGSFPVYACTHAKPNQEFDDEGNLMFFYGSQYNDFWKYYSDHIDNEVSRLAGRRGIVASLERQKIAITDIILSCKRKEKSARDSDLLGREYNYKMLGEFLDSGVTKIICTSKGVLGMLEHVIARQYFNGNIQLLTQSVNLPQVKILDGIKGALPSNAKPISMAFLYKNRRIEALAIPSPGSAFRGLRYFGYQRKGSAGEYLSRFLGAAFDWFKG